MDVERFRSVAAVPATRSCRRGRRSFHFPSVLAVAPPLRSVVRPSIHVCPCTFYPRRTSPIEGEVSSIHTQFCSPISAHHVRDCIADMLGLPSSVRSGRSGFSHAARRDLPPPSLARSLAVAHALVPGKVGQLKYGRRRRGRRRKEPPLLPPPPPKPPLRECASDGRTDSPTACYDTSS